MDKYGDIETALSAVGLPFYHGMPEFCEGSQPESYIVYKTLEIPYFYASGEYRSKRVTAMLSVFTPIPDNEIYDRIEEEMKSGGYDFSDSTDVGTVDIIPRKYHYSMDFTKVYERKK